MAKILSHLTFALDMLGLDTKIRQIEKKLTDQGDTELAKLSEKLSILEELKKFALGQFLIANQGINGIWSHYISYEYPRLSESQKPQNPMERMLIEIIGSDLRIRLELVKELLQKELDENRRDRISLLSVPCGVMADLSTLDFSRIEEYSLFGVDLDPDVLKKAKEFNENYALGSHTTFDCKDAWNLELDSQFDVIVCLGLNIYVKEMERLLGLYSSLRKTLKPGGKLMLSFPTPEPMHDPHTERHFKGLNPDAVRLRRIIFYEIVEIGFGKAFSSLETTNQLKKVGFQKVEIKHSPNNSPNIAIATK